MMTMTNMPLDVPPNDDSNTTKSTEAVAKDAVTSGGQSYSSVTPNLSKTLNDDTALQMLGDVLSPSNVLKLLTMQL